MDDAFRRYWKCYEAKKCLNDKLLVVANFICLFRKLLLIIETRTFHVLIVGLHCESQRSVSYLPKLVFKTENNKAIPVTGRGGIVACETPRLPLFPDNLLADGAKVANHTYPPPFKPRKVSDPKPSCGWKVN
jgi:hypothetical protein